MYKKFDNLILKLKRFFNTDFKKIILLIIISILIIIFIYLFGFFMAIGLIKEREERREEIDKLCKKGICNYEEPCDFSY